MFEKESPARSLHTGSQTMRRGAHRHPRGADPETRRGLYIITRGGGGVLGLGGAELAVACAKAPPDGAHAAAMAGGGGAGGQPPLDLGLDGSISDSGGCSIHCSTDLHAVLDCND